jgi:branched-chain amino acid transport system substrate-binding protein
MKKMMHWLILATLGLATVGCLHLKKDVSVITIGAVYNLTGSQRDLDLPSAQGARAAVERINRNGGILGRQVALTIVDGESQPHIVAAKTAKMLEDNPLIPGIIGLSDTDMVLAAAPVAAGHKRVFLTSGATSPLLPEQVPNYLFLACFGDNVQAAVGAEWAYSNLGARNVLILYNKKSTYSRLLQQYFRTRFEELGGRVLKTILYTPDVLDALAIQPAKIDMVYLSATPDEVLTALAGLRKAGISSPVLGGDGLDIGPAWQEGREFEDVFFTTHAYLGSDNRDPRVTAFRKSFAEVFPGTGPDTFAALGFDSVNLLAEAIHKAGSIQPQAVRKALANIDGFQGVTGTISYRSDSKIPTKSVTIINVSFGKQRAVGEYIPAKTPQP